MSDHGSVVVSIESGPEPARTCIFCRDECDDTFSPCDCTKPGSSMGLHRECMTEYLKYKSEQGGDVKKCGQCGFKYRYQPDLGKLSPVGRIMYRIGSVIPKINADMICETIMMILAIILCTAVFIVIFVTVPAMYVAFIVGKFTHMPDIGSVWVLMLSNIFAIFTKTSMVLFYNGWTWDDFDLVMYRYGQILLPFELTLLTVLAVKFAAVPDWLAPPEPDVVIGLAVGINTFTSGCLYLYKPLVIYSINIRDNTTWYCYNYLTKLWLHRDDTPETDNIADNHCGFCDQPTSECFSPCECRGRVHFGCFRKHITDNTNNMLGECVCGRRYRTYSTRFDHIRYWVNRVVLVGAVLMFIMIAIATACTVWTSPGRDLLSDTDICTYLTLSTTPPMQIRVCDEGTIANTAWHLAKVYSTGTVTNIIAIYTCNNISMIWFMWHLATSPSGWSTRICYMFSLLNMISYCSRISSSPLSVLNMILLGLYCLFHLIACYIYYRHQRSLVGPAVIKNRKN